MGIDMKVGESPKTQMKFNIMPRKFDAVGVSADASKIEADIKELDKALEQYQDSSDKISVATGGLEKGGTTRREQQHAAAVSAVERVHAGIAYLTGRKPAYFTKGIVAGPIDTANAIAEQENLGATSILAQAAKVQHAEVRHLFAIQEHIDKAFLHLVKTATSRLLALHTGLIRSAVSSLGVLLHALVSHDARITDKASARICKRIEESFDSLSDVRPIIAMWEEARDPMKWFGDLDVVQALPLLGVAVADLPTSGSWSQLLYSPFTRTQVAMYLLVAYLVGPRRVSAYTSTIAAAITGFVPQSFGLAPEVHYDVTKVVATQATADAKLSVTVTVRNSTLTPMGAKMSVIGGFANMSDGSIKAIGTTLPFKQLSVPFNASGDTNNQVVFDAMVLNATAATTSSAAGPGIIGLTFFVAGASGFRAAQPIFCTL